MRKRIEIAIEDESGSDLVACAARAREAIQQLPTEQRRAILEGLPVIIVEVAQARISPDDTSQSRLGWAPHEIAQALCEMFGVRADMLPRTAREMLRLLFRDHWRRGLVLLLGLACLSAASATMVWAVESSRDANAMLVDCQVHTRQLERELRRMYTPREQSGAE